MVSELQVVKIYSNADLELSDFCKTMREINKKYRTPVFQSKLAMLSALGIEEVDKTIEKWFEWDHVGRDNYFHYRGDLLRVKDDLLYIMKLSRNNHAKLEVGAITKDPARANKLLSSFATEFRTSLKKAIDGRRARHLDLKWYLYPSNDRVHSYVAYEKTFVYPTMNPQEIKACEDLLDEQLRTALLKIARKGALKEAEKLWREKDGEQLLISSLLDKGLIDMQYSITCRKTAQVISVVRSYQELEELSATKFCTHCGQSVSKEIIEKLFVVSDLGRRMTAKSHWMTVWLTRILIELGIPEKNIVWSLSDEGEEIDCAVEFKDRIWIFELKDRDFESGDAHPLYYRYKKFKANKAIIITTGKVSKNARKVFEEFNHNPLDKNWSYLLIEGIDKAKDVIEKMIFNRVLQDVFEKCTEINAATSFDFEPIFKKLFGKYALEHKGEFVKADWY